MHLSITKPMEGNSRRECCDEQLRVSMKRTGDMWILKTIRYTLTILYILVASLRYDVMNTLTSYLNDVLNTLSAAKRSEIIYV